MAPEYHQHARLPHHPGNAAWPVHGPGNAVLEITNRRRPDIARAHIGPGPAGFLGLARRLTAFAACFGCELEVPVVTAVSIDAKLGRSAFRLDHAGPAHAGRTARRLEPWRHPGFEPTNGGGAFGRWIGKGPRAAAWIPLAPSSALSRIPGPQGKAGIVAARPVEADLGARSCSQCERDGQAETKPKPSLPHCVSHTRRPAARSMLEKRAGAGECRIEGFNAMRLSGPSARPHTG
jgi:hypothetical protein